MVSATDSFIKYLSTELAGNPGVAWVRTSEDPASADLKLEALNISILGFREEYTLERPLVSLDIVSADERQAMLWAKRTRDKLIERQYTPELDYENNAAATGRMVAWDAADIHFQKVRQTPHVVHFNATLELYHAR